MPSRAAAPPPAAEAEKTVELPAFTVTAERELPPPESWRYARLPGMEILSNASDSATQQLLRDFRQFDLAVRVVWPVLENAQVNLTLILCGAGGKFDDFARGTAVQRNPGSTTLCLPARGRAAIVVDLQSRVLNVITEEQIAATTDGETTTDLLPGFAVDHFRQLKREYIRLLLRGAEPRAPAWLEEGLAQLFMTMQIERRSIVFGRVEDPNLLTPEGQTNAINAATADAEIGSAQTSNPAADRDFNRTLAQRGLQPLDAFFAVTHEEAAGKSIAGGSWSKQAQGFVHMCLYGRGGRFRDGFIKFVARLAHEPVTEALFKECFGRGYRAMEVELRGYVEFTEHNYQEFRAKGAGLPDVELLELREATEAEIGLLKGRTLLLAGNPKAALATLLASYVRGERTPELVASFGLAEREAGTPERARTLLETACRAGTALPEAHLALAQMRLAEFSEQPVRADGRLPAAQAREVLLPLFTARTLPPSLPEVYEAIAEVWSRCAATPTRENLAVLDEGVRLFPRNAELIWRTARLNADNGFAAEASALADLGWKATRDPAQRERFAALRASLAPSN